MQSRSWFSRFAQYVFILCVPLYLMTSCGPGQPPTEYPSIPADAYNLEHAPAERVSAVEIWVACDGRRPIKNGSGVILNSREVMTAHHVVDCRYHPLAEPGTLDYVRAVRESGESVKMYLDRYGRDGADSAVLKAAEGYEFTNAPEVLQGNAFANDIVCAQTSVPFRQRKCGIVDLEMRRRYYTGIRVDYGNSGSGVFNARGELVGLVTRIIPCAAGGACGGIVDARIRWFDMIKVKPESSSLIELSYNLDVLRMQWDQH